jgi:hypothetical protein
LGLLFMMIAVIGRLDMASAGAMGPFPQVLSNPETTGSRFIEVVKAALPPQSTGALLIWLAAPAFCVRDRQLRVHGPDDPRDCPVQPRARLLAQFVVMVALLALLAITNPFAAAIGFVLVVGGYGPVSCRPARSWSGSGPSG